MPLRAEADAAGRRLVRPNLIASPFHDVIIWSGHTFPYVGTCGTRGAPSRRIAERDKRDWRDELIWFILGWGGCRVRHRFAILGETYEIKVVVVIGENRFRFVAEA